VAGLTKYCGNLLAVDRVTFDIPRGEVFGFSGSSRNSGSLSSDREDR